MARDAPRLPLGGAARRRARARRRDALPRVGAARRNAGAGARRGADAARATGARRVRGRGPGRPRLRLRVPRGRRAPARPVQPLAARGPARPVARARRRRVQLDRRRVGAAATARPRALRAARRHVHARGDVRRGDPVPARPAGARRHRDRADARRRVPGRPRLGLRRRLPLRCALRVRRPTGPAAARGCGARRGDRGDPRRRPQPPRGVRGGGDGGVRPVPDRPAPHAVGQGRQPRRRAVRPGAGVDPAVGGGMAPRLPRRRAAAGCDPRAARLQPRAHRRRDRAPRPRRRTRARS